jgi:hypothetical protein
MDGKELMIGIKQVRIILHAFSSTIEIKWRKALVLEALSEELIHQFKG